MEVSIWAEFADDRVRLGRLAAAIRNHVDVPEVAPIEPEIDEGDEAPEGRLLLRQHKIRERSPSLARKKKRLALKNSGTLSCEVCGFDFKETYGTLGEGFIECHHVTPLSKLQPGSKTRPQDLALVCANCHRMLHRGGSAVGIANLRKRLAADH